MNEKTPPTYRPVKLGIKEWAEHDRPREKLTELGKHALTDAELIGILLNSGSDRDTAVSLAQRILNDVGNDLNELGRRTIKDLCRYHGMGPAKSITVIAAMELGRRRQMLPVREKPRIVSSRDAYNCLAGRLMDLPHEEFWVLCLNQKNRVLSMQNVGRGGVALVVADPKVIFRTALEHNATGIVIAHNHPSGNPRPSEVDVQLTHRIAAAGEFLQLNLLDHIIIAANDYYSFADNGILNGRTEKAVSAA